MVNRDKVWKEFSFRSKNNISLVISQMGKAQQQKNQQYVHSAGGF